MAFTSTSKKTSEFIYPGATETWVYLDEHPDSINDAGFFNPHVSSWIDQPATYHNGAGGFAFADGHSEIHKWKASLSSLRLRGSSLITASTPPPALGMRTSTG
jgi:prepilin-type processing-associated H-X9-DG protein